MVNHCSEEQEEWGGGVLLHYGTSAGSEQLSQDTLYWGLFLEWDDIPKNNV